MQIRQALYCRIQIISSCFESSLQQLQEKLQMKSDQEKVFIYLSICTGKYLPVGSSEGRGSGGGRGGGLG